MPLRYHIHKLGRMPETTMPAGADTLKPSQPSPWSLRLSINNCHPDRTQGLCIYLTRCCGYHSQSNVYFLRDHLSQYEAEDCVGGNPVTLILIQPIHNTFILCRRNLSEMKFSQKTISNFQVVSYVFQ